MLQKSYYALNIIIIVLLGLVSCSSNDNNMPPTNTVVIQDNSFTPNQITVAVGRPVVWRNQGNTAHTVTSGTPASNPGKLFDSGTINPGSGFTFTFTQAGDFVYFCKIHGTAMSGVVVVR